MNLSNRSCQLWTWTCLFHVVSLSKSRVRGLSTAASFGRMMVRGATLLPSSFPVVSSSFYHPTTHAHIPSSTYPSFSSWKSKSINKNRSTRAIFRTAKSSLPKNSLVSEEISTMECFSTLTLLEHINLNVPNHDYILDFYVKVLGFGLDPRRAQNVVKGSGTVWMNCGASQFHLPFGEEAQVIPGSIGLWYDSLDGLKERLEKYNQNDDEMDKRPFSEYTILRSNGHGDGNDDASDIVTAIRIVDRYGNVFYCRDKKDPIVVKVSENYEHIPEIMRIATQPVVTNYLPQDIAEYTNVAEQYGLKQINHELSTLSTSTDTVTDTAATTDCKGISYVEFLVPRNTADKISEFYNCVFDATTTVYHDASTGNDVAIAAFGSIDAKTGKSSQSLLFRETDQEIPPYDGHHIALYVGNNQADFEQAFKNAEEAQVVWVNPRFSDKATNLNTAKKWKQFRFKNIIDLETGKMIFELEHEVRSIEHEAWPGKN
mmetsp:Transcript_5345/g.10196  ORF Transcript_5345/g.10196 Transcript_5345/m.10196 type:complete len:486 (-) Transcript_5345:1184-2641(-)